MKSNCARGLGQAFQRDESPAAVRLESLTYGKVYQDLVLAGQRVAPGRRDGPGRWEILAPHLPAAGSVLDVGSNLGWFGLKICEHFPQCVVASVEADERSATLQRLVLQSHGLDRMCLLTHRADARLARRFARAGQQFDAVLCLSVLHWLPDHRELLSALGPIARRLLIEHPDPRETGAGVERIRREIGFIGPYLRAIFPDRPTACLRELPSHRDCPFPRQMWLVDEPAGAAPSPSPGLEVSALLRLAPSWPPRSWWASQLDRLAAEAHGEPRRGWRLRLTPGGLERSADAVARQTLRQWRRRVRSVPQTQLLSPRQWCYRRARRLGGAVLRGLGIL